MRPIFIHGKTYMAREWQCYQVLPLILHDAFFIIVLLNLGGHEQVEDPDLSGTRPLRVVEDVS